VPRIDILEDRIDVTILSATIDREGIPHVDRSNETISRIAAASGEFDTHVEVSGNVGRISIPR
jgi:hypothetical protein